MGGQQQVQRLLMGNRPCAPRVVVNSLSLEIGIALKKVDIQSWKTEIFSPPKVLSINGLSKGSKFKRENLTRGINSTITCYDSNCSLSHGKQLKPQVKAFEWHSLTFSPVHGLFWLFVVRWRRGSRFGETCFPPDRAFFRRLCRHPWLTPQPSKPC